MNFNDVITESQLTPFEKAQDNADYFASSLYIFGSVQKIVESWNENMSAIDILDWENDKEDRAVLKTVIQTQRELSDALVEAANKFENILGINA